MPRSTWRRFLAASLASLALSGCSQWYYELGEHIVEAEVPSPDGHINLQDTLDRFGPPQRITQTNNGYALAWEHWHIRENKAGVSLGAVGADFLSIDIGEMHMKGEFILLTFDKQHRLSTSSFTKWNNRGGGGRAIQPFVEVVDVLDSDDLTGSMSQHEWGAATLAPITEALNRQSSADNGYGGLEQRGTPSDIGQHSLRMD